ncbi:hypothetical protein [Streptomyces phaeochromogenes]|uniref:hypothetical protein n=1 Tax=Streptomyces phaeochromogenes TaxID=1923 RepID=UPI0033FD80D1|nr:hypothetical protein OHB08_03615 [Streptomyces phaeochromogenes]
MPDTDHAPEDAFELATHWRRLVNDWVRRQHRPYEVNASSVTIEFDHPEAERKIQLDFAATSNDMLLVMATDDRYLKDDQLALAAAVANAWNIEWYAPTLSVYNLDGEQPPYLLGFRALPMACRITQSAFRAMADQWLGESQAMFTWCHRECGL